MPDRRCGRTWAWLIVAALLSFGFGPPVLTDGRPGSARLYPEHVQAAHRLKRWPSLTAKAALVVDLDADQVLYARRAEEPLPPASTVKLMTALLTVRYADLGQRVVVSARAASTPGSRMGLVAGEVRTVGELLYGLLLPSGNDAAVALAEQVAGSEDAFVRLMNEDAAMLGLRATRFVNAHGSDAAGQTTSAADLVVMAKAVLAHPLLAEIVATPRAQVGDRSLVNTNQLLGAYPGADGVKTGTSDAAGECLVASVSRAGHRLLTVVLGSQDRYADTRTLLDFVEKGWQWQNVVLPNDALAWTEGPDGVLYRLRTESQLALFLPRWQWSLVQPVRQLDAAVPLTSTLPVGTLTLTFAGQPLAALPLTVWPGP